MSAHPIYALAATGASGTAIVATGVVTSPVLVGAAAVSLVVIAVGVAVGVAKRGGDVDFKNRRGSVG